MVWKAWWWTVGMYSISAEQEAGEGRCWNSAASFLFLLIDCQAPARGMVLTASKSCPFLIWSSLGIPSRPHQGMCLPQTLDIPLSIKCIMLAITQLTNRLENWVTRLSHPQDMYRLNVILYRWTKSKKAQFIQNNLFYYLWVLRTVIQILNHVSLVKALLLWSGVIKNCLKFWFCDGLLLLYLWVLPIIRVKESLSKNQLITMGGYSFGEWQSQSLTIND